MRGAGVRWARAGANQMLVMGVLPDRGRSRERDFHLGSAWDQQAWSVPPLRGNGRRIAGHAVGATAARVRTRCAEEVRLKGDGAGQGG